MLAATLPQILAQQAARRPDAPAIVDGTAVTTYRELAAAADRVTSSLLARGVRTGERIAVLAHDSAAWFAVAFGVAAAGAVLLPLNWRLGPAELAFQLQDAGVRRWFVGPGFARCAVEVEGQCAELGERIELGEATSDAGAGAVRVHAFASWLDRVDPSAPAAAPSIVPEQPAVQMYTSGTTGRPKGVVLAHRSFVAVRRALQQAGDPWLGWSDRDRSLLAVPAFHIGGFWWAMTAFDEGACTVLVPQFAGWRVLAAIAAERITKAFLVPAMLQICLSEPDCARTDFSSLDTIVYGGSPIPRPNLEAAMRTFGCRFAQIYGLTETGNTAVCLRPEDHRRPELFEAAGRPYPGVAVKIVDVDGRELPTGVTGEICLASPANMLEYWRRPEATAATLRCGFVHTGDAGFVDAEGYVHVCDRIKDMICSAGENLYPAEIESVLCSHPAVAEAAVIGVPDARWGELAKALVVLRPGASVLAGELLAHVRLQLADFKVPRSVEFLAALPRTPSGKIQKHVLREPFWVGHRRRVN